MDCPLLWRPWFTAFSVMISEWFLYCLLLIIAAGLLIPIGRASLWTLVAVLGIPVLGLLAAAGWQRSTARHTESRSQLLNSTPQQGRPDGYVSSDNCRSCHPAQYDSWHRTFHRTMTQLAGDDSVVGDFNNVELHLSGKIYLLHQRGNEFWIEIRNSEPSAGPSSSLASRVERRVGLLTGSH